MRALSGLTPALSRRLQRQLLAHLPPAAASRLRRTLSLRDPPAHAPRAARSHSADHSQPAPAPDDLPDAPPASTREPKPTSPAPLAPPEEPEQPEPVASPPPEPETVPEVPTVASRTSSERTPVQSPVDAGAPLYSTLPRPRRRSNSRERTPILASDDFDRAPVSLERDLLSPRPGSARAAADRPLLSKYLTPERTRSLDEPYSSDGSCIASEPSYASAYGSGATGSALRRHSLRAPDPSRRRVSRFLRTDFFDSPADENVYARHKKERELETQKILREIREKKNKSVETSGSNSPEGADSSTARDDSVLRKSLSPVSLLASKDRSRSNTPFFPILDKIKETAVDATVSDSKKYEGIDSGKQKSRFEEITSPRDSRLTRPKSYPVKTLDAIEEPNENASLEYSCDGECENRERSFSRESRLVRPKSYPASSPSPEKVYISRTVKKDDTNVVSTESPDNSDTKNNIEVSFSITLPRKKPNSLSKTDSSKSQATTEMEPKLDVDKKPVDSSLNLKKYQVVKSKDDRSGSQPPDDKIENRSAVTNGVTPDDMKKTINEEAKSKDANQTSKKDPSNSKNGETETTEKKVVKKKVIKKVSSKTKTDLGSGQEPSDAKSTTEKKKVIKKVKEKPNDDDGAKPAVTKKKSVLQSIGHKLEKLATKSSSPEKLADSNKDTKKDSVKPSRNQREQSVPVNAELTTESNLIKRAVTLTDVAALDTPVNQNKTTVSKVLGLFKKFEPKERKSAVESAGQSVNSETKCEPSLEATTEGLDADKPRRPTSLLLNGLGRKNKYDRTSSDSVTTVSKENDDQPATKKETESKNIRNSLKLDFSRLPRVKKIVPTNPVIEPQIININPGDGETEKKDMPIKHAALLESNGNENDTQSRSRSRSRSTISNSEIKSDFSADLKISDKNPLDTAPQPFRSHDSTTPEKEDIVDRIRRKSFYSRFNEKKQRRKSSLVGPGATEYDPVARIHSQPSETKYDVSPTSPGTYDVSPLSPGLSVSSDLSPSTERYRSLLSDLPSTRNNLRFDSYGLNDKIDTYRSLDRNEFRKYPRSYLDYDQPTYGTSRYSRTKSLLENSDTPDDTSLVNSLREPLKYNRTLSMYSPGNYATYRPKRTRNSAIILKESEKEPSPENILEKIRQRKKISISVTRKPDSEEPLPRSDISPKGEGDSAECSEKVD